ncbi:MAG: aminopeptidase [Spirochaetaceae bacterium]|jgi:predicted aminopeptidase|nr:aminopeptidase [Spirochaetaceae bacterium]
MSIRGFWLTFIPVLASCAVLSGALVFSGCYTLKQGAIMLGYLGKAVALEDLEDTADPETRAFISRVEDIRRFAMNELGLRESKNYTRYVEIDRDYLAAVVSACAADSFTRHEWTFPVVGTVPYKGFFDTAGARKEALSLRAEGLDVWVRGVDAFSTLGWFRDPLYSYMKKYSEYHLADLIIHELVHATVFLRGQAQFNEQLAEFIGTTGARLYIAGRFGLQSPEYLAIDREAADAGVFREYIRGLIQELEAVYGDSSLNREVKLQRKAGIIAGAQKRFAGEYESRFTGEDYRGFATLSVNNAYLDLFRLYHEEDSFLKSLYRQICETLPDSGDPPGLAGLRRLIEAAKSLPKGDPREGLRAAVLRTPGT